MSNTWHHTTLQGGLPLFWQQRPGAGLLAARLWIRGGSSRDPLGQRGAMQLLAGSMTRGAGPLDAESLASLDALALRLDAPAEEPERLTQRLSAGSPTGAWFFETGGREPGAWLIYPPTGVGDRFRHPDDVLGHRGRAVGPADGQRHGGARG